MHVYLLFRREIFPYVVILIGIENFWIITKSVTTTKKDLPVKERVGIGLHTLLFMELKSEMIIKKMFIS